MFEIGNSSNRKKGSVCALLSFVPPSRNLNDYPSSAVRFCAVDFSLPRFSRDSPTVMASPFNPNDVPTVADLIAAGAGYLIGAAEDYGLTDDEEEEEEEDEDDEDYVPVAPSSMVSQNGPRSPASNEVIFVPNDEPQNTVEEETNKRRRTEGEEASCSSLDASQGNGCNLTDIDGLNCPICMDVWTNGGDHHIWCPNFLIYFRF